MPIGKITGQGLSAVALLWGCWLGERQVMRRATLERARVLRDIERLRRPQPQPVSAPAPGIVPRHRSVTAA